MLYGFRADIAPINSSLFIRFEIGSNVNMFIVEQLPIVDIEAGTKRVKYITDAILSRGCRLVCISSPFSDI